jgi:signal transduction histidine kinase/CheY-like chemotaxis protein
VKHRSLRQELTRASLLTTAIALLLCAAALLLYELTTYRSAWTADLRTQADLVARSSAAALAFNEAKTANDNLAFFHQQPRVRAAAVYDAQGALFASYRSDGARPVAVRLDPKVTAIPFPLIGGVFELVYPVERDGERLGTVYLRAQHDVWRRVGSYAAILSGVMALSLLVAALVFGRLEPVVVRPLHEVTRVARTVINTRDWRLRAAPSEYEDIGVLVVAFNRMLDEVQQRTGELESEMAQRVRAQAQLHAADRRKDEFLAMLAHELRNPLATMKMSLVLLRRPGASAERRDKSIDIIDTQLSHMVRLINDLLDVSRLTTGKLSLQTRTLDLVDLVRTGVEVAAAGAAKKGLRIGFTTARESLFVDGDHTRLTQTLANLLTNACRYTEPGGAVQVDLRLEGGSIEIAVSDTGVGVEPAQQARIFEMFEQGDKSLERGSAGLGIGLTLARQLARLHGGDITLHSAGQGQGSTFTLRLPWAELPPEAPAPLATAIKASAGTRVLVADDNTDLALGLAELLGSLGYAVEVVHDGAAAIDAARERRPDVALLDIGMPQVNGYDVARALRADPRTAGIPLVAITGWGQPAEIQAAEQAGFARHLVKPVAPEILMATLDELLA